MRVINNRFINGINGNWEDGILIKIGENYPLYISDKNTIIKNGNDELTVISDVLPIEINGNEIEFVSQIKLNINPESALFFQPISYFHILLIRNNNSQEILDRSFVGSEISIYLYFIDPSLSTVEFSEMVLLQKGEIKSIGIQNDFLVCIECSIGDLLIKDRIPDYFLNKSDYHCLPAGSEGKSIPLIYGRFCSTNLEKEEYDLAPAIQVDDFENIYLASSRSLMAYQNKFYFYNNVIERYSKILSNIEFINSSPVSIRHHFSVTCEAIFRLKQRGFQMSPGLLDRYLNFIRDVSSVSFPLNTDEALYLAADDINDPGYVDYYFEGSGYGNIKLSISIGNAVNGLNGIAAKIIYFMNNDFYFIPGNVITEANSNSTIDILIIIPQDEYFRVLKSMEFGIVVEPNGMVEFKNMCVKIKFVR